MKADYLRLFDRSKGAPAHPGSQSLVQPRPVAVVVSRLDEHAAAVGGAGHGNAAPAAFVVGGAFARNEAEVAGEQTRVGKAAEVADLGADPGGGERVDPAEAGVPYFRSYDLRHTCATLLLYEGRTLNEVAGHLGHSDPGFTARTYAHVMGDAARRRRITISESIRKGRVAASRRPLVDPSGAEPANRPARSSKKSLQIRRADARTRTGDPFITSEVLYQLSYVGRNESV
jgi:Phage integrase family